MDAAAWYAITASIGAAAALGGAALGYALSRRAARADVRLERKLATYTRLIELLDAIRFAMPVAAAPEMTPVRLSAYRTRVADSLAELRQTQARAKLLLDRRVTDAVDAVIAEVGLAAPITDQQAVERINGLIERQVAALVELGRNELSL